MGKTNIIELNGKRYDAVSGILTSDQAAQVPVSVHSKPVSQPASPVGRNVDGIIRPAGINHSKVHVKVQPAMTHHQPASPAVVVKSQPARKHPIHHLARHRPEHAATLMRSSVKKPGPSSLKAKVHLQASVQSAAAKLEHRLPAQHHDIDIARLSRAKVVSKSQAISRYGEPPHNIFAKHFRPLAVKAEPAAAVAEHHAPALEAAVANATSHEQKAPKRPRRSARYINFAAAGLALLLIGGFIAYQNAPNIDLRLISSRAGFSATMPGFKPAGFGITTPISYSAGEVTLAFHSSSDSRNFNVIEQQSNWDSQTLLDDFVSGTSQNYQTVQSGGRTIYIYASNATWVNGNIWYRITGNANLNTNQLVNIATSM